MLTSLPNRRPPKRPTPITAYLPRTLQTWFVARKEVKPFLLLLPVKTDDLISDTRDILFECKVSSVEEMDFCL
jgi:hypothetical protein